MKVDRAHEIDGVRGWAAMCVLLLHVFQEMLGNLLPVLHNQWLSPLFSGGLAVNIFFVLSGDALSVSFFANRMYSVTSVDKLLVRRYTRLVIPIFISCALVYLIRNFGADFHADATVIIRRQDWLGEFINFDFTLFGLFRYTLIDVFTNHTRANSYNPFLWTMSIEMIGSMMVFMFCYLWQRLKNQNYVVFLIGLFLILLGSNLGLFLIGMWIGSLRSQGFFKSVNSSVSDLKWGYFPLVACAVVFISTVLTAGKPVPRQINLIMSCLFVFSVQLSSGLKSFFSNRLSRFLGEISFPLYLVHFPILISFMSWLIVLWSEQGSKFSVEYLFGIGVLTVVVCILAAMIFRGVERRLLASVDSHILKILS